MAACVAAFTAAITALNFAACANTSTSSPPTASSRPPTPSSSATPQATGPLLTGMIMADYGTPVTGLFSVHAERVAQSLPTQAPAGSSCADFAHGLQPNPASFIAPEVQTTGDTTLYLRVVMPSGYAGPGTYTSESAPSLQGTLAVGIGFGSGQTGGVSLFRSSIGGTTTLIVHPDGSGSIDFSSWGSDEVRGNAANRTDASGTATWTCR